MQPSVAGIKSPAIDDDPASPSQKSNGQANGHNKPKIAFTAEAIDSPRSKDLLTLPGQIKTNGCRPHEWPHAQVVKEPVDNVFDAVEGQLDPDGNPLAPECTVEATADGIRISDNGRGIPPTVVPKLANLDIYTSSRGAGLGPTRGFHGAGIRIIAGMAYVLDPEHGRFEITTQGVTYTLRFGLDTAERPLSRLVVPVIAAQGWPWAVLPRRSDCRWARRRALDDSLPMVGALGALRNSQSRVAWQQDGPNCEALPLSRASFVRSRWAGTPGLASLKQKVGFRRSIIFTIAAFGRLTRWYRGRRNKRKHLAAFFNLFPLRRSRTPSVDPPLNDFAIPPDAPRRISLGIFSCRLRCQTWRFETPSRSATSSASMSRGDFSAVCFAISRLLPSRCRMGDSKMGGGLGRVKAGGRWTVVK